MDWVISDELSLTVGTVVGWISAGAMIIGGVIPYIPQYRQIRKTKDAEGFSLLVCLALLIANTLRIMFWFGKHFEYPLLIQSIIMNVMMFLMIHLCVRVRHRNQVLQARQRIFTDFDGKFFWNWSDFQSYVDCMLVFTICASLLMYIFIEYIYFVEVVGFLAVFTEAMLGTPQLFKNYRNKSTEGMSLSMVILWTCGDIFKTTYFLLREAPMQFWVCGSIQVTVDILILLQVTTSTADETSTILSESTVTAVTACAVAPISKNIVSTVDDVPVTPPPSGCLDSSSTPNCLEVVSAEVHADADSQDAAKNRVVSSKMVAANGLMPQHRRHRVSCRRMGSGASPASMDRTPLLDTIELALADIWVSTPSSDKNCGYLYPSNIVINTQRIFQ